jgi:transcriptional regulator with XRE-family HTH domain
MTNPLISLGSKISELRKTLGFSQEAFADICGFDRTYISMIERGKRNLSFCNLLRVAEGLGISVSQLTEGIEHGTNTNK